MPIVVNLDVMMARRHKGAGELAEEIGITPANLSILKNNKAKAVRFSTLEALCRALDCQPEIVSARIGRGWTCPARGLPAGKRGTPQNTGRAAAGHAPDPRAFPQANVCFTLPGRTCPAPTLR